MDLHGRVAVISGGGRGIGAAIARAFAAAGARVAASGRDGASGVTGQAWHVDGGQVMA